VVILLGGAERNKKAIETLLEVHIDKNGGHTVRKNSPQFRPKKQQMLSWEETGEKEERS